MTLVLVDDGKGGAGHSVRYSQPPGQAPGKGGLARPQVAGKGDYRPRLQLDRQPGAQGLGLLLAVGNKLHRRSPVHRKFSGS